MDNPGSKVVPQSPVDCGRRPLNSGESVGFDTGGAEPARGLSAPTRRKFPQRGDDVVRIQPPRVIYTDVGQSNHAFSIDEKCSRRGQVLCAIGAVEEIEPMAELAVRLLQF